MSAYDMWSDRAEAEASGVKWTPPPRRKPRRSHTEMRRLGKLVRALRAAGESLISTGRILGMSESSVRHHERNA